MHCSFLSLFFPTVFSVFFSSPSSFLTMATKKFGPSKNPIRRRGSSSSSSSILDSVRFRDEKTKDDFFENFSDWAIHS